PQLPIELWIGEQHLPGDRLEQGAIVFLVRKLFYAVPAETFGLTVKHRIAGGHDIIRRHVGGPLRRRPWSLRANARVPRATPRRSAASRRPHRNQASRPR